MRWFEYDKNFKSATINGLTQLNEQQHCALVRYLRSTKKYTYKDVRNDLEGKHEHNKKVHYYIINSQCGNGIWGDIFLYLDADVDKYPIVKVQIEFLARKKIIPGMDIGKDRFVGAVGSYKAKAIVELANTLLYELKPVTSMAAWCYIEQYLFRLDRTAVYHINKQMAYDWDSSRYTIRGAVDYEDILLEFCREKFFPPIVRASLRSVPLGHFTRLVNSQTWHFRFRKEVELDDDDRQLWRNMHDWIKHSTPKRKIKKPLYYFH